MTETVVTTGAISRTKLQSNRLWNFESGTDKAPKLLFCTSETS